MEEPNKQIKNISNSNYKSDIVRKLKIMEQKVPEYFNNTTANIFYESVPGNGTFYLFTTHSWENCDNNTNITDKSTKFCDVWEAAQHNLFQTANLFFAAAFIVPKSFKQNILLVRALLSIGFFLTAIWSGFNVCGPDIFIWSLILCLVNFGHTISLTMRFLPPHLNLELTDLYLKQFKPLRVGKKHFKELTREAQIIKLTEGDTYAVEDLTPADEKLSILLRGKLKVTCDEAHLHFIYPYQFIDSPEWEATHETSDDVFQVTIRAEEDCVYLSWPRLRLERILRHRTLLRQVFESMIGKDITNKLYSLNEHVGSSKSLAAEYDEQRRKQMNRSVSVDAVNTGTSGLVRSDTWTDKKIRSASLHSDYSTTRGKQYWMPIIASQFPDQFPFAYHQCMPSQSPAHLPVTTCQTQPLITPQGQIHIPPAPAAPLALVPVMVPVLAPPPLTRKKLDRRPSSFRRSLNKDKEVKFETPV